MVSRGIRYRLNGVDLDTENTVVTIGSTFMAGIETSRTVVNVPGMHGSVPASEVDALKEVARYMGLSESEVDSMLKLSGGSLDDAYAVLGVSPDATDDEVRKAYRTLALKHHPDRVAALGDDIRRAAEKKFQEINDAKERIYKARGM